MIDLIFHATSKEHMEKAAAGFELYVPVTEKQLVSKATEDQEAVYEEVTVGWEWVPGITVSWWAGSGKMLKAKGTYDKEGNELTPPIFVDGIVGLFRLHGEFFENDKLESEETEQCYRSKVAAYIMENGEESEVEGIKCNTIQGVSILNPDSLSAKLKEWNVPGHVFSGGNSY